MYLYTRTKPFAALASLLLTPLAFAQPIVYIDDDGPRDPAFSLGSIQNPYERLPRSDEALLEGPREYRVCAGTYVSSGAMVFSLPGSGGDVTIRGGYTRHVLTDADTGDTHVLPHFNPGLHQSVLIGDPASDDETLQINGPHTTTLEHLRFIDGQGLGGRGSSVHISGGATLIKSCVFENTSTDDGTGPLVIVDADVTCTDTIFRNNTSSGDGGAVHATLSAGQSVMFEGCAFEDNSAATFGGAIDARMLDPSVLSIVRCRFVGNAADEGGAVHVSSFGGNSPGEVYVTDSLFHDNTAADSGGALQLVAADLAWVVNSTITRNSAPAGPAIHYLRTSVALEVGNAIVWDNAGSGSMIRGIGPGASHVVRRSILPSSEGAGFQVGVINLDPQFFAPGDYRVMSSSPAIDAGSPALYMDAAALFGSAVGSVDLAGAPRFVDSPFSPIDGALSIDIGCYELPLDWVDPTDGPCSEADLAEPYGQLDFSDIAEFLRLFSAGCP